jgi:hypothetical protein
MRRHLVRIFFAALLSLNLCAAEKPTIIRSPKGTTLAVVSRAANREVEISIKTEEGSFLAKHDYFSEDHQRGFALEKGEWTPDGNFFVYSLYNVGGHQPWQSPVFFFSTKRKKIYSLDQALNDSIAFDQPPIVVSTPDKVTVHLYFQKKTKTVALSSLKVN